LSWNERDLEDLQKKRVFEEYLENLVEENRDSNGLITFASFYIFKNNFESIKEMISRNENDPNNKKFLKYLKLKIKEIKKIFPKELEKLNSAHGFKLLLTESILLAMALIIRSTKDQVIYDDFNKLYSKGVVYVWDILKKDILNSFSSLKKLDGGNVAESGIPMCPTPYRELIFFKREKSELGNLKREYIITKIVNERMPELVGTFPIDFLENVNSLDTLVIYRYPGQTIRRTFEVLDQFLDNPKYAKNKVIFREWLTGFTLDDVINMYARFQIKMADFDNNKAKEYGINLKTLSYGKEFDKKIKFNFEGKFDGKIISKIREVAYELDEKNKVFSHMDLHSRNVLLWSLVPVESDQYYSREAIIDFGSVGFASKYYDLAFLIEQPSLALSCGAKASLVERFISQSAIKNKQDLLRQIIGIDESIDLFKTEVDEYNKTALFVNAQLLSMFLCEKEQLSFTKSNETIAEEFEENINYYYNRICNGETILDFKNEISGILSESHISSLNGFRIIKSNILNNPILVARQNEYLEKFLETGSVEYLKRYENTTNEVALKELRKFEKNINTVLISKNPQYKEELEDILPKISEIFDEFRNYLKRVDAPPIFDYLSSKYPTLNNFKVKIFNENISEFSEAYKKIISEIEANTFLLVK